MTKPWLDSLCSLVEQRPFVVLRLSKGDWESIAGSRKGLGRFSLAKGREVLQGILSPTLCLFHCVEEPGSLHLGVLKKSKRPLTSVDLGLAISRGVRISPGSETAMADLVTKSPHEGNLRRALQAPDSVVHLSSKLSSHLLTKLAAIPGNLIHIKGIAESFVSSNKFKGNRELQDDAIKTALAAFGLAQDEPACSLQVVSDVDTALVRVPLMEDAVIEHDARSVSGYSFIKSHITGRAEFRRGDEKLEVITANRRDLEHCFGVDLVYVNLSTQSVVMLQYKMLEPVTKAGEESDWIYRPDAQLAVEITRMKKFGASHGPGPSEYRMNPQVFFFKFVKRNGAITNGGVITPLDHFELIQKDRRFQGPRNGIRISYKTLGGNYLRQAGFLDLVRSGYIGAYAKETGHLQTLIEEILKGNKALVLAIQDRGAAS